MTVASGSWSGGIPLQVGENVITVKVSGGEAAGSLRDREYTIVIYRDAEIATIPKTGDDSHMGLWLMLMLLSATGLLGVKGLRKEKAAQR